jgi:hypothetical protein
MAANTRVLTAGAPTWEPHEDAALLAAMRRHGHVWGTVAAKVGRSREACQGRYWRHGSDERGGEDERQDGDEEVGGPGGGRECGKRQEAGLFEWG